MDKVIGIDISKASFDASYLEKQTWKHVKLPNTIEGFEKLSNGLSRDYWIVMKASGPYYLPLASWFYNKGYHVCVLNPLIIRRYSQKRLLRAKTDKKDAQTIAQYGKEQLLQQWHPDSKEQADLHQLYTSIEVLAKQIHQSSRQLEAFRSSGVLSKSLERNMENLIAYLVNLKAEEEKQWFALGYELYAQELTTILTIPGVGRKTALFLCIITNGLKKFSHYKQMIAYIGFSPRIVQSGTSVKGKGHICKMGTGYMRKLLYLCAWSAKRCNTTCKNMYDRLKQKGKPERVIKVAIANKLIKQIFAVGKQLVNFNNNYVTKPCL